MGRPGKPHPARRRKLIGVNGEPTMAKQEQKNEKSLEKEVTLVAYASEEYQNSLDNFVIALTGVDVTETKETEKEKAVVEVDLGGNGPMEWEVSWDYDYDRGEVKRLHNDLLESGLSDSIDIDMVSETTVEQVNSRSSAAKSFFPEIGEEVPKELPGGIQLMNEDARIFLKWLGENDQSHAKVRYPSFEEQRILSKEEKREADDMYENLQQIPCAEFEITIEASSDEEMEERSNALIPELYKTLVKYESVSKVRWVSCKVKEEREGECYVF